MKPDLVENRPKMEPRRAKNRIGTRKMAQHSAIQLPRAAMVAQTGLWRKAQAPKWKPKSTKIDEQIYLKNYAAALQKFETAFENVPYVHNIKYQQASKCAILTKQYDKAYAYICQLRKQGDTNDFLNKKQFK